MNSNLRVQKFGGATVATVEKIQTIAKQIAKDVATGSRRVIVVSAMGSTTNQLIELAHQVSAHPLRRELDMLLTTGERISMALLSMALNDLGVQAVSFTGSQAGIITTESFSNARIVEVRPQRILQALDLGKVVVVAGFQGVSGVAKEITTLGRGGSDTSAIALASALKAERCDILKDVASVFTADPKICPKAQAISHLSFDQLERITRWGAKVISHEAAEMALEKRMPIYVGPAHSEKGSHSLISSSGSGTLISDQKFSGKVFPSFSKVVEIKLLDYSRFLARLSALEIPEPTVVKNTETHYWLTGPTEVINEIEKLDDSKNPFGSSPDGFSFISKNLCVVSEISDAPLHDAHHFIPRSEHDALLKKLVG